MDNLIENLTNTLALLTQSYKTYLPQTSNQLRTSSNHRNQATVQNGRVVVQNVQGRQNRGQGNNARGAGHIARNLTQPKRPQNSEYFKDKMLLMQAQENGVALDEEQLLFLAGGHDNAIDEDVDEKPDPLEEQHEMHDDMQPNYVVDSHANYTSDSNMIPYDQYVKDNAVPVVQSNLATYKEQVELYERRARFELTEREQKIDEQLRIVITDRNIKEENLKKELHSVKLQLASTINHNKSMVEEVTSLKKDFKQKENKYLEEFLNMKALKEKVEEKLYKQDQSLQTVHMLCKPKPYYDELNKVAIGYKNPLCLTRAKQAQPSLYNGYEIIKTNHVPAIVHNSEDTLKIAEITRKKMNDKMKNPECVQKKVKITPPDYSKENYLATFTLQKQLIPKKIFWSQDLIKITSQSLTTQAPQLKVTNQSVDGSIPQNTPATLSQDFEKTCNKRITPTGLTEEERGFEQTKACYLTEVIPFFKTLKEHFEGIQKAPTKEIKEMKYIFEELEAEVDQNGVDRKYDEIEWKNLLIANDNLIANCLSKEVFYVATNSELNVSSFTEMHDAHTSLKARCLELKVELSNLRDKIQKDNHDELIKRFSNLEESVETLREIVEEAKVKRPLDGSLELACHYTKHSQELLEYVIGTYPKALNTRDNKHASTSLPKKKQVTFEEQCAMLKGNTHKRVEQLNCQKTNVPVPPSTRVNSCTDASRSQPRSNTKKNRILPAKSVNMKKVKEHPRTIKSSLKTMNRVDSSISSKHTVINSNSHSVCQTCNKCLISANHDRCVVTYFHSMNASPSVKNVMRKVKQVWKPKQVKQVWKLRGNILTTVGRTDRPLVFGLRLFKTYDGGSLAAQEFREKIHRDGLTQSVFCPDICNSDLEVAFRKHSCYVQDTDGVELIKNGVVERQNQTFVEATRTMLIFSKAPMFLWAEVVATACYTQNRSLIHTRHNKTPYELVHDRKPDLTFFQVFGALCYPTNDSEDLGKLQPTAIGMRCLTPAELEVLTNESA
ncbi:retrovirus-related pol polyprotein from transposon TNT 1-94 [Tanacetum coccineum]